MRHYDPAVAPEAAEWLELDEQSRIALAADYHKSAKIELANVTLHAACHVLVENQLAERYEPTVSALARLLREGVGRHNAIHAIGSVLAEQMQRTIKHGDVAQAWFDAKMARLKAKDWKG